MIIVILPYQFMASSPTIRACIHERMLISGQSIAVDSLWQRPPRATDHILLIDIRMCIFSLTDKVCLILSSLLSPECCEFIGSFWFAVRLQQFQQNRQIGMSAIVTKCHHKLCGVCPNCPCNCQICVHTATYSRIVIIV